MSGVVRALAAAGLAPRFVAELERASATWFGSARVPVPGAEQKSELALVASPLGPLVAKRFRTRGLRARVLLSLRARGRAERAFAHALELARAGLATPEALLVLPQDGARILVTRFVEAPHPWDFLRGGGTPAELVTSLARDLARLHAAGFRHRDLKASNLLVRRTDRALEIVWTDLDGLARPAAVGPRVHARDLARLSMSFESAAARAAGLRADAWPTLVRAYLACRDGREPAAGAVERLLVATRRWRERAIRAHLARGDAVR